MTTLETLATKTRQYQVAYEKERLANDYSNQGMMRALEAQLDEHLATADHADKLVQHLAEMRRWQIQFAKRKYSQHKAKALVAAAKADKILAHRAKSELMQNVGI